MRPKILVLPSILVITALLYLSYPKTRHLVPNRGLTAVLSKDTIVAFPPVLSALNSARVSGSNRLLSPSDACFNALGDMEDVEDVMLQRTYGGEQINPASDTSVVSAYWGVVETVGDSICQKILIHRLKADDPHMDAIREAARLRWFHHLNM